jgi:hypothetical protein
MVTASMKMQLRREIEDLENLINSPMPSGKSNSSIFSSTNYYSNLDYEIKKKKKELYGGALKVKIVKKTTSKPKAMKSLKPKAKKTLKKAVKKTKTKA